ncbi:DNA-methyltransferase [Candidatus Poriferisodalis sp.]|uniref:DNA-methyltransferase n=1 Tax=Candidatus Poriferisodalis sp. TaxID=3101277 RepID=UPI003B011FF4
MSTRSTLDLALPADLRTIRPEDQRSIPALAKDPVSTERIRGALANIETDHKVILGDARELQLEKQSVHLVVTSPPYWTLKEYPPSSGQLGRLDNFSEFLAGLQSVWERCYDALVPGGRLVCVVGDVCLSRRQNGGRHAVVPLHASIQMQCCDIGFDNLAPIIWHKISNVSPESNRRGAYLGKPFEPNGVIKNDIEYILMLRKPGGYRSPSAAARLLSVIAAADHDRWFRQIWNDIRGASTRNHPAPFPVQLAERLIRMFSFVGDTVLDPFTGTASTQVAARQCGRHSIGVEIDAGYHAAASERLAS